MRRTVASRILTAAVPLFIAMLACARSPVADGGIPVTQVGESGGVGGGGLLPGVTPNAGSLSIAPFPTVPVRGTPTPDPPRANAVNPGSDYLIQPGDTLLGIAARAGVAPDVLLAANPLLTDGALPLGEVIRIPAPAEFGSAYKIIPNSELVYSPTTIGFDTAGFVNAQSSYLAAYSEEVGGRARSGGEIVEFVAQMYSVNPRLLLALLEHQSGWVTQAQPAEATLFFPLGHAAEPWRSGLYRQLAWAANQVNMGYYLWRAGGLTVLSLPDGSTVAVAPSLNAGTAGVQHFFAQHATLAGWQTQVGPGAAGFAATYRWMFGEPFGYTFDPLLPDGLTQPALAWPFAADEGWYFTGGPHGAWDTGSAWGALDFAPPDTTGCEPSPAWVRAAAAGLIVRSEGGAVVQDLSGDGFEQTGWALFYMHLAPHGRAGVGTFARPGDTLGHPSCEGGFANARHLHIARKYNGEWIPADADLPFVLDGWVSGGLGSEYDGVLVKGDQRLEACDCGAAGNLIYFPE